MKMIVLIIKYNYWIYKIYVSIIIIKFCILIEKLCPIVKIFISKFYNNLKIMSIVDVITIFRNKDTLK